MEIMLRRRCNTSVLLSMTFSLETGLHFIIAQLKSLSRLNGAALTPFTVNINTMQYKNNNTSANRIHRNGKKRIINQFYFTNAKKTHLIIVTLNSTIKNIKDD